MEDKSISQLQMCNIGNNVDYRGMAAIYSLYEMSGLFWKNAILLQGSFSK